MQLDHKRSLRVGAHSEAGGLEDGAWLALLFLGFLLIFIFGAPSESDFADVYSGRTLGKHGRETVPVDQPVVLG